MKSSKSTAIAEQIIHDRIHLLRGKKVMLDYELAELYGVETKRLKEQVKRNIARFPADFMFELNEKEFESLRSLPKLSGLRPQKMEGAERVICQWLLLNMAF